MRFQKIVEQLHGQLIVFHDQNSFLHRKNPLRAADAHAAAFQEGKLRSSNSYDQDANHPRWRRLHTIRMQSSVTLYHIAFMARLNCVTASRLPIAKKSLPSSTIFVISAFSAIAYSPMGRHFTRPPIASRTWSTLKERTVLPAHRDCATGGFRAIAAFNRT